MDDRPQRVFHSVKDDNSRFARIDNDVLRDTRLSFLARGIAAEILSRPHDWQFSAARLAAEGQEGVHACEGAIRELESAGYVKRHKTRDACGRITSNLTFRESPTGEKCRSVPTSENRQSAPTGDLPTVGEPTGRSTGSRLSAGLKNDRDKNDCNTCEPSASPPVAEKVIASQTPKVRSRNPLLDALVALDGSDPAQATQRNWGKAAKALAEIKVVCAGVTVAELLRRAGNYRLYYPTAAITPLALSDHWALCDNSLSARSTEPPRVGSNIQDHVLP